MHSGKGNVRSELLAACKKVWLRKKLICTVLLDGMNAYWHQSQNSKAELIQIAAKAHVDKTNEM